MTQEFKELADEISNALVPLLNKEGTDLVWANRVLMSLMISFLMHGAGRSLKEAEVHMHERLSEVLKSADTQLRLEAEKP